MRRGKLISPSRRAVARSIFSAVAVFVVWLAPFCQTLFGQTLTSGKTTNGSISVAGGQATYSLNLTAGNSIVLQMAALSGDLIPDIRFYDPQDNLLADYWNYTAASLHLQVTGTGTYTVVVRDVNGVGTGAYQLEYAQIPGAVDAGGGTLNSGQTLTNTISVGSFHVYAVSLTAGNSIVLQMAALSGNLIPDIRFYDPQGNLLADYWNYTTTSLQLQVTGTGTYTVVARDANGVGAGAYSLTLSGNITPNSTLRIVQPPVNQTMKAGMFVQFTVAAAGASPIRYQWQFKGQNIPNATNATLTFNSVTAANSGGYSVIVSNPYGSVTSATASLAVLTDGANGNKPVQITVPTIPPKPSNKDSLVVITHGWEPLQPNADLSWMTAMSNAIQSRASSNWAIANFVWLDQATFPDPDLVLCAAETKGRLYGQQLAAQGWKQIHFIGHSAGAALIQVAAAQIPLSTTVQCTFLDPYVGLALQLQSAYGSSANWADCYFTQDFSGGWTGGDLPHAYNVDVDWLDPNHETFIYGSALIAFSPELNTESHGYSHEFYTQSVTNNPTWCSDAAGYGFTLSEEAGGQTKWSSHPTGNNYNPYVLCGPPNAIPSPPFPVAIAGITIDQVSHAVSDAATAIVNGAGFLLSSIFSVPQAQAKSGGIQPMDQTSTNTPAWLAVGVTVTNAANFVQFDAGFTDTNAAQGLLTVYWNTNQVGIVDERVANTNLKTYRFSLPGTVSSGLYTLSFRLDSFVNSSSIAVTNMATGFVGVTQPITLAISLTNGSPMVRLTAATNFTYLIQSSTNLMNWSPTALLLNTNGNAQFLDSAVTNSRARFYRAVLP